ncbi:MAG: hypothetical protein WCK32_00755 [Chlorobiaceae bacterium]
MITLMPIRKIRIDTAGLSFSSSDLQTFESYQFEPATYTDSQLTYTHQSGHVVPYGEREEVIADLVRFTFVQMAALYAFSAVDVEFTFGLPGESASILTFLNTRLQLSYNVTEGVQKLKLTVQQFKTSTGNVIPETVVSFGCNDGNTYRFDATIVECRVGFQVLKLPYRNGLYTDVERVHGFKRKATITIAPTELQLRDGFGILFEGWLTNEYKYVSAYNFYDDAGGYGSYRQVTCTNSADLMEERIDSLLQGRNIVLEVVDKYKQSVWAT